MRSASLDLLSGIPDWRWLGNRGTCASSLGQVGSAVWALCDLSLTFGGEFWKRPAIGEILERWKWVEYHNVLSPDRDAAADTSR